MEINKKSKNLKIILCFLIFLVYAVLGFSTDKYMIIFIIAFILIIIINTLSYIHYSIVIEENGITYTNILGIRREYNLSELRYRIIKIPYTIRNNWNVRSCTKTIFYHNQKQLFSLVSIECKEHENENINKLTERMEKYYDIYNEQKTFKLKVSKVSLICYGYLFFMLLVINLLLILSNLMNGFPFNMLVINIFLLIALFYFGINFFRSIFLKVYVIENKGFYKEVLGNSNYYGFEDVEKVKINRYVYGNKKAYKIMVYKNANKILTLTNNFYGFYNFIDELKDKEN